MSIIVDAQLPTKLCEILDGFGYKAMHVDQLPKGDETPDTEIAQVADEKHLISVFLSN